MNLTTATIALLSLLVLSAWAPQRETLLQPVVTTSPDLPAPPAWAMVAPPSRTSTQRLWNAFSGSLEMTSTKSTK